MSAGKVVWLSRPEPVDAACPLCGTADGNAVILRVPHWNTSRPDLDLARCAGCESGFYPDAASAIVGYPSADAAFDDPGFPLLLHHYLELSSSVETFVAMLEGLPFERLSSVLEVGCNMGVALDYCRAAWGAEVAGVEPSGYGRGGAELLGLPIEAATLDRATTLGDRRFDLVCAIEVIEHVPSPADVLAQMRGRVADGGILFITLPSMEVVTPETGAGQLYGVLSAGAHWVVPSARAAEKLLRDTGLGNLRIHTGGGTHLVAASDAELPPYRSPDTRERTRRYLRERLAGGALEPRVELALRIHANDVDPVAMARVDGLLGEVFGISLRQPDDIAERVARATDLYDFGRTVPYGLPLLLRDRAASSPDAAALGAVVAAHGLRVDYQVNTRYEGIFLDCLGLARRAATLRRLSPHGRAMLARAERAGEAVPELAGRLDRPSVWTLPGRVARAVGRRVRR